MNVKDPVILAQTNIDQPDSKYRSLAKRLGVTIAAHPSPLLLQRTLTDLSIAVYDFSAVRKYLIEKRPAQHAFCWVPASTHKAVSRELIARYPMRNSNGAMNHGYINHELVYDKPVPYPVLLAMDAIVKKSKELGFTPSFYISDYTMRERKPTPRRLDPFLAVGTSDSGVLLVIERWDEPGFREETYSTKKNASGKTAGARKAGDANKGQ